MTGKLGFRLKVCSVYVSPSCERITGFKPEEFIEDKDLIIKYYIQTTKRL